jgi:hypothetical protein
LIGDKVTSKEMCVREVLIVAASVIALGGSAEAAQKASGHKWFMYNAAENTCGASPDSPQGFYNKTLLYGHLAGVQMLPIAPDDVEKDDKGNIKVTIRGTRDGEDVTVKFFTLLDDCKSYAADKDPQQAPSSDIN